MSLINVIFFDFEEDNPSVIKLKEFFADESRYKVVESDDHEKLAKFVSKNSNAFFIPNVTNKTQLQKSVFIIKAARKLQHNNLFKSYACLTYDYAKNEKVLKSYGVLDFFTPDEKESQLLRKAEVNIGKLKTKVGEVKEYEDYAKKVKETILSTDELLKDKLTHTNPIDISSDIWIIKSKQEINFVLRKWVIEILGPSTHIGKWNEVANEEDESGEKQLWEYRVIDEEQNDFTDDSGSWFFEGDKPNFDWKKQRWIFSSTLPKLYFEEKESKKKHHKINFTEDKVVLAKNSEYAKLKEPMIEIAASVTLDVVGIEKAKEEYRNLKGKLEAKKENVDEFSKLIGRSQPQTDKDTDAMLSGSSTFQEELSGNMSGKMNYQDDESDDKFLVKDKDNKLGTNLSGKGGTDNLGGDNYSGKILGDGPFSDDPIVVRELNLESGEVSVDLMYDPDRDDFNLQCEFEDLFENELVVLVPKNSVLLNENVTAEVVLKYNGEEANITCRGRIIEIEPLEEDKETLIIDLTKMSREKYMKFMELFKERQENIVDFMVRAKGH